MKVITLTPNPALDLSGHACDLIPNEKNYVFGERRDPGGNGINAARIASRLKLRSVQITATGWLGGSAGEQVRKLLEDENVSHDFSQVAGETRTNVTINNEATHQQTRLTFPGPKISLAEQDALIRKMKSFRGPGLFVIGGSLPQGCRKNFHAQIVAVAHKNRFGVIADVPAKSIPGVLSEGKELLLLKPNQTELEEWADRKLKSISEIVEAGKKLAQSVCLVVVSLADKGALLIYQDQAWFAQSPKVKAKGTVGAGDSMVGALSAQLAVKGITLPSQVHSLFSKSKTRPSSRTLGLPQVIADALSWGLAAGAATAQVSGTSLAKPSEIRRLRPQVKIRPFSG